MSEMLVQKKCKPCEGTEPPLTRTEAQELLRQLPRGWVLAEDSRSISKEFKCKAFRDAQGFINKVADIAEAEGHHPNILWRYNKVKLTHTTHAIRGLSENDFILAAKSEDVFAHA